MQLHPGKAAGPSRAEHRAGRGAVKRPTLQGHSLFPEVFGLEYEHAPAAFSGMIAGDAGVDDAFRRVDSAGSWAHAGAGFLRHVTACAAGQSAVLPCPASPLCVFLLLLLHTRLYAPKAATSARAEENKEGAVNSRQHILPGLALQGPYCAALRHLL